MTLINSTTTVEDVRLRIVHVIPVLEKGGGERVAIDLANHAAAAGNMVTILASMPINSAMLPTAVDPRVILKYVSNGPPSRVRRYLNMVPWALRNLLWLRRQNVIHCHMTFGAVFGTLVRALFAVLGGPRPAVIETYHAVGMRIPSWHRTVHAWMACRRDALVLMAEDPFWRRFVTERPRLLSRTIPNGIAFEDPTRPFNIVLTYARRAKLPHDARLVVGSVGRLAPERCPHLYIEVFLEIWRALGPQVHLLLAGDGPEMDRVRALVDRNELGAHVHLPGLTTDPAVPMSLMDVYVTINIGPTTGIAALEAAHAGLPVVALQMVRGYAAKPDDWIWSSHDVSEVAREIVRLLLDEAARKELARRQQAFVNLNHTVEAMASAYNTLYQRLLAQQRALSPMVNAESLEDN